MNSTYDTILSVSSTVQDGTFCPERVAAFHIQDWSLREMPEIAGLSLSCIYSLHDDIPLAEEFLFPNVSLPDEEEKRHLLNRLGHCIHLAAGVSYYKAACPETVFIHTVQLPQELKHFFNQFYCHGLGEFCVTNERSPLESIDWKDASDEIFLTAKTTLRSGESPRVLLPIGGGKDSFVSMDLMEKLQIPATPTWVGGSTVLGGIREALSLESLQIGRRLSPLLRLLNDRGALNGHVPITGIHSFVLLFAAVLYNYRAVVFSNEASANSGNLEYQGMEVNHQYSKSLSFEKSLHSILPILGLHHDSYFSLLRPYSELAICKAFAKLPHYHDHFVSCNANFSLTKTDVEKHWCTRCPKCIFVFLALAPFLPKTTLDTIFGTCVLENSENTAVLEALLGLREHRPFECVGDTDESRAAIRLLSAHPDWTQSPIVQELNKRLPESIPIDIHFQAHEDHCLPEQLVAAVHDYFSALR